MGALCLSSSGYEDPFGLHGTPTASQCHEDKHKAPASTLPRPLSLQNRGGRSVTLLHSGVEHHQNVSDQNRS